MQVSFKNESKAELFFEQTKPEFATKKKAYQTSLKSSLNSDTKSVILGPETRALSERLLEHKMK